jgi:hypothetical protein
MVGSFSEGSQWSPLFVEVSFLWMFFLGLLLHCNGPPQRFCAEMHLFHLQGHIVEDSAGSTHHGGARDDTAGVPAPGAPFAVELASCTH